MARVLAPTEKRASKLVEATYRRAAQSTAPEDQSVRAWLLRLLLQTYAARRSDAATTSSVSTMRRPADLLQDFRFQTAEDALQRTVPVAFALRSPREQLVLTLCDIVALDPKEAATVLDTDPQGLHDEAASAREALWDALSDELTAGERTLIEEELPDDALRDALSRVVAPHLGPLPPTLRPSVSAIMAKDPTELAALPDDEFDADDDSATPSHPFGTPPHRPRSSRPHLGERLQKGGIAFLILLALSFAAYSVSTYLTPSASTPSPANLIQLSAERAGALQPTLETSNAAEAELFVTEQLGRNIAVPRIDSSILQGVSIVEMSNAIQVPAFVFTDQASNQRITTYAYTYAVIDQLDDQVQLAQDVRENLQSEQQITLHRTETGNVLVWRVRDDIYLAVTQANPGSVRSRILPAS
jgi:DNA-directed RNA polymerase specialized sigma24 family protein